MKVFTAGVALVALFTFGTAAQQPAASSTPP